MMDEAVPSGAAGPEIAPLSLAPLLAAAPAIQWHVFAAMVALVTGVTQMLARKGTPRHRVVGYVFVVAMLVAAVSSFFIHEIRLWGGWSPIHILSVVIVVTVTRAVWAARHGRIEAHRKAMSGAFFGGLLLAGLFTLVPGRIMHAVVFGGTPESGTRAGDGLLWIVIVGIVVFLGAARFGWRMLRARRPTA